ncbi:uncharacterized protein LAESUDRAFT_720793 [Laetiporus sulphureus 93-53]|uniref:Integral membrane protein n=1 Tax=Laetiporus sulphureus 93-53 TaxID=1314785 RepID=A0A165HCC6_9APHY|nr:uncharacterized protein LAESUDRAFT_720793 [Laetiporus sulphureus 93-53]KZT11542.1 hypothetical protein LAESUDRAFT_720793 [Laetiporus sulphureus 93-53]
MPSSFYVPILVGGMLITGSSNSLWSKWQDMQCVENCDDPNPTKHVLYEQPVWQTLQMFLGEMLCFLPVLYVWLSSKRARPAVQLPTDIEEEPATGSKPHVAAQHLHGWKILLLWFPAACDLTGTTLMNIGLLYTPVSIYQMTRGALVLFVGVLSVIFLRRRLWLYQWISLVTVMAGVSLVGYSGSMIKDAVKEPNASIINMATPSAGFRVLEDLPSPQPIEEPEITKVLVGVFFILFAQVFTATQFVIEEKIMARYSVAPLVAVGWEGFFGALSIVLAMPLLAHYAYVTPFFDLPRGWYQMIDTPSVLWSGVIIAISISLFNFFGLSVTRHVSATVRSLTDTCRTLSIWIVSLGLGWETIMWPISLLQVLGFGLLVYGTFLFNNLVKLPLFLRPAAEGAAISVPITEDVEENRALLSEQVLDETAALPADLGQSGFDTLPPHEHLNTESPPPEQ